MNDTYNYFKILFFGRLRDFSKNIENEIPVSDEIKCVEDVILYLDTLNPHLGKELRKPFTLVSVNKNLVKTDFPIVGGEEVAFLPPVTGG